MDFTFPSLLLLSLLVLAAADTCDRCIHQSKAKFFGDDPQTIITGACGYKDKALDISWGGYVANGNPTLIKQGAGCGACYKIRCKDPNLCDTRSVKVVVTNSQGEDQTAFVLSPKAFSALAKPGKELDLKKIGNVDIEYKRVFCQYGRPMSIQVDDDSSQFNLAVTFLYPGDQTDIVGVQVASVGSNSWVAMDRRFGSAVWTTGQVPQGAIKMRLQVARGLGTNWVLVNTALPNNWKNGQTYNTGINITDVVQESCSPCDLTDWPSKN